MTTPIPSPRGYPVIGNLLDLQDEVPLHAVERLLDIYGPIVKFSVAGKETVVVGNFELFDELCDETRFFKQVSSALATGTPPVRSGLFTTRSEKDADWGIAHRILMPAFGPLAIEGMFDEMHDIASQLVLKWARLGRDHRIFVTEDFSKLTLDTIALCAMDYRFNSFYQDAPHPFVQAMTNTLTDRSNANQLGGMLKRLMPGYQEQLRKDSEYQSQVSQELVQHRRDHPTEKMDLLNSLIYGKDPKTGKTMDDALIVANMRTFLVAGHETTSGLLSFAFAYLLKNPRAYFAAQQEVDTVAGKDRITPKHLNEMRYLNAVLRETLRLEPTAPAFVRGMRPENPKREETIGGGKYAVPEKGVLCLLRKIHRDPKIWGDDAHEFRPERMLGEHFDKLPRNAWKPFGTGLRACIGRDFAWQEALLVVALILQNFDAELDDPDYELCVVQSLTMKPRDFYMRASLRKGVSATSLQRRLVSSADGQEEALSSSTNEPQAASSTGTEAASFGHGDLAILYGSNTGTCQSLASRLASEATQRGFRPVLADLDSAIDRIPVDKPVVIVTASYEGQPTDNAARFFAWLEQLGEGSAALKGAQYAVFGCGHTDWAATYQRIPKAIDETFAKLGGESIVERGEANARDRDVMGEFAAWKDERLWPALEATRPADGQETGAPKPLAKAAEAVIESNADENESRAAHLRQSVRWATVVEARSLTAPGGPEKRHIEFELPENMTYTVGDYLSVLPLNPAQNIKRAMTHFALPWEGSITIKHTSSTCLPVGKAISITELLRGYVELAQPATREDVATLLQYTPEDAPAKSFLERLLTDKDAFATQISEARTTILDLLERYPTTKLPFATFLEILPPLQPRFYSISSSPLANAAHCTLTYSVVEGPSWSSRDLSSISSPSQGEGADRRFFGVAGSYLATLRPGDRALVAVRPTANKLFRLPADPEATPVVMICAGSGLAPFRGFVQERAVLAAEGGRKLAPALLLVGCRSAAADRLYAAELDGWARAGAVDVRYALSRESGDARAEGCRYVQDRLLRDRAEIVELFQQGARFYICGGPAVAEALGRAGRQIVAEEREKNGRDASPEEVDRWMKGLRNQRFIMDIF